MAAQGIPGRRSQAQIVGGFQRVAIHVEVPQEGAGAIERAPRIIANHQDAAVEGLHAIALGAAGGRNQST